MAMLRSLFMFVGVRLEMLCRPISLDLKDRPRPIANTGL